MERTRKAAGTTRGRKRTAREQADGDAGIEVLPVTPDRWADLEDLFERPGPRGGQPVSSGCWCMYWRLEGRRFDEFWGRGKERGAGNKAEMRSLVKQGREPGLLAYVDGMPAGWCSVAPREEFRRLERSRTLAPVDDQPVWSIVCFYIHARYKRRGIAQALLRAAVDHAVSRGATIVEGYPVRPGDSDPYTGFESMFRAAGFEPVREGGRRSIFRLSLNR
jgi:GNAT superfamily N-acetyltransferase